MFSESALLPGSSQQDSPSLAGWRTRPVLGSPRRYPVPSYSDLLRDPRWQRKRLEMLNAAGWKCTACGRSDNTLHVHHRRYVKGRKPWEYTDQELRVLCAECHQSGHEFIDLLMRAFDEAPDPTEFIGVAAGFIAGSLDLSSDVENSIRDGGIERSAFYLGSIANLLDHLGANARKAAIGALSPFIEQEPITPAHREAIDFFLAEPDDVPFSDIDF